MAGEPRAFLVLPEGDPALSGERELFALERAELVAELAAIVEIIDADPGAEPLASGDRREILALAQLSDVRRSLV